MNAHNSSLLSQPPLVVLLHGLHSSKEELVFIEAGLKRAGIQCCLLEISGYTINSQAHHLGAVSWHDWLDELTVKLDKLHQTHGPLILSGISTGANLALAASLHTPRLLAGVVPLSTSIFLDGWSVPFYSFLLPLVYYTPLGRLWSYKESPPYGVKDERIRKWIAHELQTRGASATGSSSIPNEFLRENHRLRIWLKRKLKQCGKRVPLLAIHAKDDELASMRNVEFLKSNWSYAFFNQVVLHDSYHMICIDRERSKVVSAMINFTKKNLLDNSENDEKEKYECHI